ncbi:MAG: hypothetical protein ABI857_10080 [Acidobacteriota bacterium]
MKAKLFFITVLSMITLVLSTVSASAQITAARTNTRQTETLLIRIETKIDVLKDEAQRFADRNTNTNTNTNTETPDQFTEYLTTLEQSVTKLHETLDNRAPLAMDLRDALANATLIDQYLVRNRVTPSAQTQWRSLKRDFTTLATSNRVGWNWNQRVTPANMPSPPVISYTVSDRQMLTLLSRIELKTNNYKRQMDVALRSDTSADQPDEAVADYIAELVAAELRLRRSIDTRQSSSVDATDVLTRATYIDQFMNRNRLNAQSEAQWRNLKADLDTLATYYKVDWNWNQSLPSNRDWTGGGMGGSRNFDARITGTYRINSSLSENSTAEIDQALRTTPTIEREGYRRRLEQRLSSPEIIVIEKNNTTVSLASSILPQVTFQADGVARPETNARGRTVTTTATADEDGLIINYQGERSSDFYLTFLPMDDGRLKVTRRIYLESGNNSITVSSVYDKIANVARWNAVNINTDTGGASTVVNDSFVVPTGTRLSAELRSGITGSQGTERFTMDVTAPGQYRGAIIGGRVISEDPAGRVAGRSRVLLVFDTISLSSGQTYRFAGTVDAVTAAGGDMVVVTNQRAQSATQPTRGVGGILGALIGAISGVPVDSAANSGATAGAILAQNRDNIDIGAGSQVMITASATGVVTSPR